MATQILVIWTYALSDNDGFLLQRSTDSGSSWPDDFPTTASQYTDSDVVVGGTYWYHVAATNAYGTGTYSNTASVYISAAGPVTLSLTVTAQRDVKVYDGTTASYQSPTITGSIAPGDTPDFSQYFVDRLIGTNITLDTSGSVIVTSGNYYDITLVPDAGDITGPPKNPDFIIIPVTTDLPWEDGWFISIRGMGATGSNFVCLEYLPNADITVAMTSSNSVSWSLASTCSTTVFTDRLAFNDSNRCLGVGDEYPSGIYGYFYTDDNGVNWTFNNIPGLSIRPADLIWDGSKWIGCGQSGTIITSSADGTEWFIGTTGGAEEVHRLLFVSGTYYATTGQIGGFSFTSNGYIYTSTDCQTWTPRSASDWPPGSAPAYWDIAYSPTLNTFMAVGDDATIVTSTDGLNWVTQSLPVLIPAITLTSATWNASASYFAVTNNQGYVFVTTDLVSWTFPELMSYNYHNAGYSNVGRMNYYNSIEKIVIHGAPPPS